MLQGAELQMRERILTMLVDKPLEISAVMEGTQED